MIPLFEALNWAVSLRDLLSKRGHPVRHRLASGLGFATGFTTIGRQRSRSTPFPAGETFGPLAVAGETIDWYRKPLERPPSSGGRESGRKAYRDLLADRPVRQALNDLQALFHAQVTELVTVPEA